MSFKKQNEKTDAWRTWLRSHRDRIVLCGVPDFVLQDRHRWYGFLDAGYDHETGWKVEMLSAAAARTLHRFLIAECGESVRGWLLQDLLRIADRDGRLAANESEWLAEHVPARMLTALGNTLSQRKLRLWAAACCRRIWSLLPEARTRRAVEVAERHADGEATGDELQRANGGIAELLEDSRTEAQTAEELDPATHAALRLSASLFGSEEALACADDAAAASAQAPHPYAIQSAPHAAARAREAAVQCDLFRCVTANLFHPASPVEQGWLTWHDGCVLRLAQAAYGDRRLPEGTLDPARLGVLADALEDAGSSDADVLGHLRRPGPHVRGCWCLDLLLGQS